MLISEKQLLQMYEILLLITQSDSVTKELRRATVQLIEHIRNQQREKLVDVVDIIEVEETEC